MEIEFDPNLIQEYVIDIALILLFIGLIYAGLALINRAAKSTIKKFRSLNLKNIKLFGLEIVNIGKQELIITTLVNAIQLIFSIIFLYILLVAILGYLPATEDLSDELVNLIFLPLENLFISFVAYFPKLFNVIVTIVVAQYLVKGIKYITKGAIAGTFQIPGFSKRTALTTGGIITFLIYTLTIILIFPSLPGYESLAFKGVATFLGALITIGGSSVIANYMAGIVLIYMHAYEKGDWVEIDGVLGQITGIGSFAVSLNSYKNESVKIPNSKVLGAAIYNYSGEDKQQIVANTQISIGYDVHWSKVNELLLEAANRTPLLKEPFVLHKKLDDFYIIYELNALLSDPSTIPYTYSKLHTNILDVFNEAEIEIMSPHYQAERDGTATTVSSKTN